METTRHNPTVHHRRSVRLREYDYRDFGAYFVTVCTHQRVSLFGEILDAEMVRSEYGVLVASEWERTAEMRAHVILDAFVVMPNHFHAVVMFEDRELSLKDDAMARSRARCLAPLPHAPSSLGSVVGGFKRSVTTQVNALRSTPGVSVWQRNYYEHIIRSEASLKAIREYVAANPARWNEDTLHPDNMSGTFSM